MFAAALLGVDNSELNHTEDEGAVSVLSLQPEAVGIHSRSCSVLLSQPLGVKRLLECGCCAAQPCFVQDLSGGTFLSLVSHKMAFGEGFPPLRKQPDAQEYPEYSGYSCISGLDTWGADPRHFCVAVWIPGFS